MKTSNIQKKVKEIKDINKLMEEVKNENPDGKNNYLLKLYKI